VGVVSIVIRSTKKHRNEQTRETRIKAEIIKVKANTERCFTLLKETEDALERQNKMIIEDDTMARENPLKKLKKPQPPAGKKKIFDKPNDKGAEGEDLDAGHVNESMEVHAVEFND
jgi:hypothetical protein